MNILFFAYSLDAHLGGIERVSDTLSKLFVNQGHQVFGLYVRDFIGEKPLHYCDFIKADLAGGNIEQISDFIKSNEIELIINQFPQDSNFSNLLVKLNGMVKIISCFHTHPLFVEREVKNMLDIRFHNGLMGKIKLAVKYILYLYLKNKHISQVRESMRKSYEFSVCTLLLSPSYVEQYAQFAGVNKLKLRVIPNPLTFDGAISDKELARKENIALIVSRLTYEKRIELAVKAWQELPADCGWKLVIAGSGNCEQSIRESINSQNIEMIGHSSNPMELYKKSKLFLMTSAFEGFSMTLLEAVQNGCVPIVFDCTPAYHDVIDNGKNGVLVADGDVEAMTQNILKQFKSPENLAQMAKQASVDSQRFSTGEIYKQWNKLFNELNN